MLKEMHKGVKDIEGLNKFATELREPDGIPKPRESKSQKIASQNQPLDNPNRNDKKVPIKDKLN